MDQQHLLGLLVSGIDLLVLVWLVILWRLVARGRRGAGLFAVVLLVALSLGALWAWLPDLAERRLDPPPGGQVMPIAFLAFGLPIVALALAPTRRFLAGIEPVRLILMGPWRLIFGVLLLFAGLAGGLAPGFYRTAAAGDILVGIWSFAIIARGSAATRRELVAWNLVGLLDLLHVLALGAFVLRPFLIANPHLPPLNLLPLVAVPLFVALHLVTLWRLLSPTPAERNTR